jgi:hypothetical protein
MPRTTSVPKDEDFSFRVPADLKAAFEAAAEAEDRPAAEVLQDLMLSYVERTELRPEPGHDAWFRSQVQAAIDDGRESIPHNVVMERARAAIDAIAKKSTL